MHTVLLYNSGGGIGDSIQILPLLDTLRSNLKKTNFYYLSAHENHFNSTLVDYKSEIKTLELNIQYFGFRWWHALIVRNKLKKLNIDKFDLIIDLQSKIRNSLLLKIIPHKYFISLCRIFKPNLDLESETKINNKILKTINLILKENFKLEDYDVKKIDKKFYDEALRLLPNKNYVGLSITQGNVYRKKEWPIEHLINISKKLIKSNKIPIFFIEKKNYELKNKIEKLIPSALFPEHKSDISSPALVTCLGKRLDFAITIDNGVMHMLSLSKVPMISLFGPTDSKKFAPDYKNSLVLDSKELYKTNNVSDITVEDVLKASKQFANF